MTRSSGVHTSAFQSRGFLRVTSRLTASWVARFNGNFATVHGLLEDVPQIDDPPAVARPDHRTVVAYRRINQPPRVISVGIHEPQFLAIVITAGESNLLPVGRERALLQIVHQLVSWAPQNGQRPQARLALRPFPARGEDPGAVGKPAHVARFQINRLGEGMRLAGTENSKE